MNTSPPPPGLPLYDVGDTARLLHCGRTKVFELLSSGDLRGIKVGRQRLISGDSVRNFLDRQLRGEA